MSFALGHAASLVFLAALLWATGYLFSAFVGRIEISALGPLLVNTTLGAIVWIYLLFLCACVGLFRASFALPVAAFVLVTAVLHLAHRARQHPPWAELSMRLESGGWRPARLLLALALPGLILSAVFFHSLSHDIGWDCNVYHLTLPKLYLATGGFRRIPFNVYSNWPHNVELLFGLAMMVEDYVLAKLVHALFLLLLVLAVFRLCRQRVARGIAALGTLCVLANPVLLFEAVHAYTDIASAFFFLIAVASAIEYTRSNARPALVLSGLCCGALAGTKLSGLAGLPCVLSLVLAAPPLRLNQQRLLLVTGALVLPTFALALPWYIKAYVYTGNPVYPLLFREFGGVEWNGDLEQKFVAWQQAIGMGRSVYDYLALPIRVIAEGGQGYAHFDGQLGRFWLVALPLGLLAAWFRQPIRPYLLCSLVYFVLWALSSQQVRFLIPVLPLLAIAAAFALAWIGERLRAGAVRTTFWTAVALSACGTFWPIVYPVCERALEQARALGRSDPGAVSEGYAFINTKTPASSRIMLLNTNFGFFLERDYIADSFFEASQMNAVLSEAQSEAELAAILARLHLTHVYVWEAGWGIPYPDLLWHFLRNRDHARLVFLCGDRRCALFELQH